MSKKNFSLCSSDPKIREHFEFKYAMLAKAIKEAEEQERMENLKDILDNDPLK